MVRLASLQIHFVVVIISFLSLLRKLKQKLFSRHVDGFPAKVTNELISPRSTNNTKSLWYESFSKDLSSSMSMTFFILVTHIVVVKLDVLYIPFTF